MKYNKFHWEKKNRDNPYLTDNLPYVAETDSFVCRNEKRLLHVGNRKYVTEAGYETSAIFDGNRYFRKGKEGCPSL